MSIHSIQYKIAIVLTVICPILQATYALCDDEENGTSEQHISTADSQEVQLETGRPNHRNFNVHFALGGAFALGDDFEIEGYGKAGGQGTVGLDILLREPIAFSLLAGYNGFSLGDDGAVQDLFFGMGFRLRFAVDRSGALFEDGGNALGNLWLDIHFGINNYEFENHGGFNLGLGYEFSLVKNFNLGPYGRIQHTPWGEGLRYLMFAFGIQVSLAGQTEPDDSDKDGINDDNDKCPKEPEDKDGFEDENGCPDPDNDQDGILDGDDECAIVKGVADKKGCPDDDPDRDGMITEKDECPYDPEDKDGFKDEDGCPDDDNDEDGVADANDKCPLEPEDKDEFDDEDGCPDTDNDGDGRPDEDDQCPLEPETINEKDDEDGCPDLVRVEGSQIKMLQRVYFVRKEDKILERSFPMLEEVASVIALRKGQIVRIDSYTDNRGKEEASLDLSKRQAEAVKKFLVGRGIEEKRLIVQGHGQSNPIADNKTKKGRLENRRVEFYFVE